MQKLIWDGIKFSYEKFGALILAIIILAISLYWQREERLENVKFHREQQVRWYKTSTEQTNKVAGVLEKNVVVVEKNSNALQETSRYLIANRDALKDLTTLVRIKIP